MVSNEYWDAIWLEKDWYEMRDVIHRFKGFMRRRGVKVVERPNTNGGCMRSEPGYVIHVKYNTTDVNKMGMLVHEFAHFELGHRARPSNEEYAKHEIEACLVTHIVLWMFSFTSLDPEDYIFRHAFWIPELYRKAYGIASQLKDEVFQYGRRPKNHWQLMESDDK